MNLRTRVAVLIVSGVCQHALLPLICAFDLHALASGPESHSVVVIAEEQTESGGAYVRGGAVYLDRVVALAMAFDPRGGCPLTDAPGWIVLGATALERIG